MSKISSKVSKGLDTAIKEAQEKMSNSVSGNTEEGSISEVEVLLNSGVESHKKRKSNTKKQPEENNSLFDALIPNEKAKKQEPVHVKTYEEICKEDIQKAYDRGYENPDFDFRNYYQKGQVVYYILILGGGINTKELKKMNVRTVYPRMLVCSEEKSCCQCVGYSQRDLVFNTLHEARVIYDSINMAVEEPVKSPKSKPKIEDGTSEGDEEENAEYGPDLSLD